MLTTFHSPRFVTEFPSKTSNSLKASSTFFQHFSIKSSSILLMLLGFFFYKACWRTVLPNPCQNLQETGLSKARSSMAKWRFKHLEHHRAKLASPFTFLINKLHLFCIIGARNIKIKICNLHKVIFRISALHELWYAFWRSFNVG